MSIWRKRLEIIKILRFTYFPILLKLSSTKWKKPCKLVIKQNVLNSNMDDLGLVYFWCTKLLCRYVDNLSSMTASYVVNDLYRQINILYVIIMYKKSRQMGTILLYIRCRMSHYCGCVKFDFNDISLYTKTILSSDGFTA
jgi:hypothetical protein